MTIQANNNPSQFYDNNISINNAKTNIEGKPVFNETSIMKFDRFANEFKNLTFEGAKNLGDSFGEAVVGIAQYATYPDYRSNVNDTISKTVKSVGKAIADDPLMSTKFSTNLIIQTAFDVPKAVEKIENDYQEAQDNNATPEYYAALAMSAMKGIGENLTPADKVKKATKLASTKNPDPIIVEGGTNYKPGKGKGLQIVKKADKLDTSVNHLDNPTKTNDKLTKKETEYLIGYEERLLDNATRTERDLNIRNDAVNRLINNLGNDLKNPKDFEVKINSKASLASYLEKKNNNDITILEQTKQLESIDDAQKAEWISIDDKKAKLTALYDKKLTKEISENSDTINEKAKYLDELLETPGANYKKSTTLAGFDGVEKNSDIIYYLEEVIDNQYKILVKLEAKIKGVEYNILQDLTW